MSTHRHIGIVGTTFVAAVDFSACPTSLYRLVRAGSINGEVNLANGASGPVPLGVLQDTPSPGQGAEIILLGTTKLMGRVNGSGCNLVAGRYVVSGSDGTVEAASVSGCGVYCAMWLGPTVSTAGASAIGEAIFYGLSTCSQSLT